MCAYTCVSGECVTFIISGGGKSEENELFRVTGEIKNKKKRKTHTVKKTLTETIWKYKGIHFLTLASMHYIFDKINI